MILNRFLANIREQSCRTGREGSLFSQAIDHGCSVVLQSQVSSMDFLLLSISSSHYIKDIHFPGSKRGIKGCFDVMTVSRRVNEFCKQQRWHQEMSFYEETFWKVTPEEIPP